MQGRPGPSQKNTKKDLKVKSTTNISSCNHDHHPCTSLGILDLLFILHVTYAIFLYWLIRTALFECPLEAVLIYCYLDCLLPSQCHSNGPGNLGSNKEIHPEKHCHDDEVVQATNEEFES